ncbi:MAG: metalloregulator ArsR/SmtB family transcription factor [Actinobacteria bacterium]|nr:metalloregulator ArsR/SmtB family transcription factor [Actinomycetota bacterium]MCL6095528.1 metalloregulator ArsR/SmtB family transcription factor [Actinomycetota bacterium]
MLKSELDIRVSKATTPSIDTEVDQASFNKNFEAYKKHADLCKVLTDPKRIVMIHVLADQELSVGELASVLGISLPNASQHLSVLRHAGLVTSRKDATTVRYTLSEPLIAEACRLVHTIVTRLARDLSNI